MVHLHIVDVASTECALRICRPNSLYVAFRLPMSDVPAPAHGLEEAASVMQQGRIYKAYDANPASK